MSRLCIGKFKIVGLGGTDVQILKRDEIKNFTVHVYNDCYSVLINDGYMSGILTTEDFTRFLTMLEERNKDMINSSVNIEAKEEKVNQPSETTEPIRE